MIAEETQQHNKTNTKSWKEKARWLGAEVHALSLALRDPRVPWYARALGGIVVAYALSPVDLIPDFIPVLGYADDLLLIPAGIYLTQKLIPREILEECRQRARSEPVTGKGKWVAAVIIFIWLVVVYLVIRFIWETAS
jgi:uncharacterized membrane protein YkvA (DUF1232 family)